MPIKYNSFKFSISWAILGAFFVFDQLVLPMSQIGGISYKFSYFILLLWGIYKLVQRNKEPLYFINNSDLFPFIRAYLLFIIVGIIAEFWLGFTQIIPSHSEAFRISSFYFLTILAFGLGTECKNLKLNVLIKVFYTAILINMLFIIFKLQLPSWLVDYYIPPRSFDYFPDESMSDLEKLFELTRPRGIFSNPNVSALMINLVALFIHLSIRNDLLKLTLNWSTIGVLFLPLVMSLIFSSRGEFLVSAILLYLNIKWIMKGQALIQKRQFIRRLTWTFLGFSLVMGIAFYYLEEQLNILSSIERISLILNQKSESNGGMDETLTTSTRFFLFLEGGNLNRILSSPIFGAGFSQGTVFPFDFPTKYCHQDWVYILMTTGILGVLLMLFLIRKFAFPLGWPVVIPWILPGFVNTFHLVFPAILFYWFMVAALRQKIRAEKAMLLAS